MRLVPQLDRDARLVRFGQSAPGKAALTAAFAAGLVANRCDAWAELTAGAALMAYLPSRRRLVGSVLALYWLMFHGQWIDWEFLKATARAEGLPADWPLAVLGWGAVAAVIAGFAVLFQLVRVRRVRRPVLHLVAAYGVVLTVAGLAPLGGLARLLVWGVIAASGPYLWYFAYAFKDAGGPRADGLALQFGTLRPFWGGTSVPFPKGAANLRRIEARSPEELSVTQLKAVKLLIWVFVLRLALVAMVVFVYGEGSPPVSWLFRQLGGSIPVLGIPRLAAALQAQSVTAAAAWAAVMAHFVDQMLTLAVTGNMFVAVCRMSGFHALRALYRPLEARRVSEFWNRYYYYFKELLVEFFFFPVFTRYFKPYRRLRLFAATMAAATGGNMLYHFLRDYREVAELGLWGALWGFQVYAFYATVLGVGIGISQLRGRGAERQAGGPWWRRARATAGVLTFFCLLEIFDQEGRSGRLETHLRFFLRLFGLPV